MLELNSRMLYNDLVWHMWFLWVFFFSHHETVGVVLSLSTQPFSTALISNTELPSLSAILRLFYLHQVNQRRKNKYNCNVLLTSWIHTRIHNGQSLKYNRLSNSSWRFTKTSLFNSKTNRKASSWCLLRLSNPKTQLANFLTRVCESSTHDLCVLPLQICKVKCDWFLSADVTEIVLVAWVHRRYFRQRQATAGNKSAFAGYTILGFLHPSLNNWSKLINLKFMTVSSNNYLKLVLPLVQLYSHSAEHLTAVLYRPVLSYL